MDCCTPAEPPHQRLPNGTGEASGGRPNFPRLWASGLGQSIQPQARVATLIDLSPGWAKSARSLPTVRSVNTVIRHRVPKEVPAHRWRQFISDCHKFLLAEENWAERAAGHRWNDLELFGCCRRPLERLGNAGLLWAINGGRLIELRRDWAVIERASDRSYVHHRERSKAADITLPWTGLQ
jgi:hypothetical protein